MIPARELRIGNIVNDIGDSVFKIKASSFENIYGNTLTVFGIPITMTIIENAGFYHHVVCDESHYELDEVVISHEGEDWRISGSINYRTFKYVHELQNLYFALTGKELPISL